MKIMFEIMTTCSKPFPLTVDDDMLLPEFYDTILYDIEYNTILMRDDVVDIFISDRDMCVSLPKSDETIGMFVRQHPHYFSVMANGVWSNVYKLYTMDRIYIERRSANSDAPVYTDAAPFEEPFSVKKLLTTTIGMFTGVHLR